MVNEKNKISSILASGFFLIVLLTIIIVALGITVISDGFVGVK